MDITTKNKDMKPLVSAIITTKNRHELLRNAVDSVLAQTYSPIELIIVDDASDEIAVELSTDSRIKYLYISKEDSRGGNYARNLGIKNAKGKYVAFLDDDDEWVPSKIEKQVELAQIKKSSLVFCLRLIQEIRDGKVVNIRKETNKKPFGDLSSNIFNHYITSTSCILAERSIVEEVGGFDVNLRKWQEYDLMIRMAEKTHIYYVDDYLCRYRFDLEDSCRISNDFGRIFETIKIFRKKYGNRLKTSSLRTKIHFCHMCVGDAYKLSKRSGERWWQIKLLFPWIMLYFLNYIDDNIISKIYRKNLI